MAVISINWRVHKRAFTIAIVAQLIKSYCLRLGLYWKRMMTLTMAKGVLVAAVLMCILIVTVNEH